MSLLAGRLNTKRNTMGNIKYINNEGVNKTKAMTA